MSGADTITYRYLDELGLAEPLLALTYNGHSALRDPERWFDIRHQCAGHACIQRDITAMPLTPKSGRLALGLARLATQWEGSCCGMWGVTLDEAVRYRQALNELGLDCNTTHSGLLEGFYPIDLPENLRDLVEEDLPEDLDELIAFVHAEGTREGALERLAGCVNRFGLVLLGPNCD